MYRVAKNSSGLSDVFAALSSGGLVLLLSWQDIRKRYRRSILGPFWITISNAVLIGSIGFVFAKVFGSGADLVPSLAIGFTLWTFISSCILEACDSFVSAEQIVKQLPVPLFVHVERVVMRNLLIFAHNAVIVPLVLVFFGIAWSWLSLLSLAGLCLVVINLHWMALLVGILMHPLPRSASDSLECFASGILSHTNYLGTRVSFRRQLAVGSQSVLSLAGNRKSPTSGKLALVNKLVGDCVDVDIRMGSDTCFFQSLSAADRLLAVKNWHGDDRAAQNIVDLRRFLDPTAQRADAFIGHGILLFEPRL